jgi:hypothetical protein
VVYAIEPHQFAVLDPRGFGGVVDGIARVCETELVLEFETRKSMFRMGTREVAIPFEEIESVTFKRGLLKCTLLFVTRRLHPASSIPGSRAGQFMLHFPREHANKAREAESLLAYGLARRDLSGMRDSLTAHRRSLGTPEDLA